ncbi:MAG TPA: four helix bundle protein [Patescibacteria group bacterium]|nr:four helix bundle protein [Patescibacteria group bacterium]
MKINSFKDLEIWQLSIDVVLFVYDLTNKTVFSRDFGLRDQVRRAVVSIPSNIAEGFEISNNNDLIRFLRISKGSLGEVKTQLYISLKLKYITQAEFNEVNDRLDVLAVKIGKFISYLTNKKNDKEYKTR